MSQDINDGLDGPGELLTALDRLIRLPKALVEFSS
jgi:hypothetical protein